MWSMGDEPPLTLRSMACANGAILTNWGRAPTTLSSFTALAIEIHNGVRYQLLLGVGQLGVNRDGEGVGSGPAGFRAIARTVAEVGKALLGVQGHGVVHLGADVSLGQMLFQPV